MIKTVNEQKYLDKTLRWIDPEGGIGDALILSAVLHDINLLKGEKFGIVRKMPSVELFAGHPAVAQLAIPTEDVKVISSNFRLKRAPGAGGIRPYNILSEIINGKPAGKENIWAGDITADTLKSIEFFPVQEGCVFISTGREYAGNKWPVGNWEKLAVMLEKETGKRVIQIGFMPDDRVPGAFDIRGKAKLKQLLALIKGKAGAIVALDSFPVQMAKWAEKPAIILWGSPELPAYSYDSQINLVNKPDTSDNNIEGITVEQVFEETKKLIKNGGSK